ncbi:MAG: hypothetical protein ACXV5Q_16755 [Frankiaceae bacterium]
MDEVGTQDMHLRGAAHGQYDGPAEQCDGGAAREAIQAAFVQAMTSADADTAMAAVQDGDALVPALTRFVDAYPEVVGMLAVDVGDITHDESGRTVVSFQLGAPGYGELPLQGEAVRVDGTWKVARSTIAGMLGAAGFAPGR